MAEPERKIEHVGVEITDRLGVASNPDQPPAEEPLRVVGWRAWYGNDRTYSSDERPWSRLPKRGVQHLVLYYNRVVASSGKPRRSILQGADVIFKATVDGATIYGQTNDVRLSDGSRVTAEDLIRAKFPDAQCIYGTKISDEKFRKLSRAAMAARDCGGC